MWKCEKCDSMGLIFFCYRLFKEAINNAVKYSDASLLQLSVHYSDHSVDFAISDNGKEFDITTVKTGNGLMNMKKEQTIIMQNSVCNQLLKRALLFLYNVR